MMSSHFTYSTRYLDKPRHWCPQSEKYAGADNLLSALLNGWIASDLVLRHETWRGGSRPVIVYYFELKRGERMMTMPVINSPCIPALIAEYQLQIVTQTHWETVH